MHALFVYLYVMLDGCSVITQVTFEGFICRVACCKMFDKFVLEVEAFSAGRTDMLPLIDVHTFHVRINFLLCDSLETTYLTFMGLLFNVLKPHVFHKQIFCLSDIVTPTFITRYFFRQRMFCLNVIFQSYLRFVVVTTLVAFKFPAKVCGLFMRAQVGFEGCCEWA